MGDDGNEQHLGNLPPFDTKAGANVCLFGAGMILGILAHCAAVIVRQRLSWLGCGLDGWQFRRLERRAGERRCDGRDGDWRSRMRRGIVWVRQHTRPLGLGVGVGVGMGVVLVLVLVHYEHWQLRMSSLGLVYRLRRRRRHSAERFRRQTLRHRTYVTIGGPIVRHGGLVVKGAHVDPILTTISVVILRKVALLVHARRSRDLVVVVHAGGGFVWFRRNRAAAARADGGKQRVVVR